MKRVTVFLAFILISASASAQIAAITNNCELGAQKAKTQGTNSQNYLRGTIPSCTVQVFLTGTFTPATIYADANSTPLTNPFTANADGTFTFFAAINQGYDIVLSGGIPPNTYPQARNIIGVFPSTQIINAGGGTVNPGQLALAQYPTATAPTVNPANFTYDAATGNNLTIPGAGITKQSPVADIRSQGAVIDGVTDISSALTASATQACLTSGVVLLPCMGSGCYYSGGTLPVCSSNTQSLQYKLQGKMVLGSTLAQSQSTPIICDGGGFPGTFTPKGPNCSIVATSAHGTLGTAISSVGTQTFVPTFLGACVGGACSAANVPVGSYISIIDNHNACAISSITRTSASALNVTATVTPPCRLPIGSLAVVAGVPDSTFNGSPMIASDDYGNGIIVWTQTGQSPSTSSGGTITGSNDDTFETVKVTVNDGTNITACCFRHNHQTTDQWGAVGVSLVIGTNSAHYFSGMSVTNAYGAGILLTGNAEVQYDGIAATAVAWPSSIPFESQSSYGWHVASSNFQTAYQFNCKFNCSQTSYPKGMRLTSSGDQARNDPSGLNIIVDSNTFISGGIKVDTNGNNSNGSLNKMGDVRLRDITVEQPTGSAIEIDPRYAGLSIRPFTLYNVMEQDNFVGYPECMVNYTDRSLFGSVAFFMLNATLLNGCVFNQYYGGQKSIDGIDWTQGGANLPVYNGAAGVSDDGRMLEGEIRGEGAGMSPSIIPYASSAVTTNPASWTCLGTGCVVNTGLLAPDGSFTAGELVTGSGTNPRITAYSRNGTTAVGDVILTGVWCRDGQNPPFNCYGESSFGPYYISSAGTGEVFDYGTANVGPNIYQSQWTGDWFHPIVGMHQITTAAAGSHSISMYLYGPSVVGRSVQFWQPFFIYIPYSAKPFEYNGSVTSGSFRAGETLTQTTSGATAVLLSSGTGNQVVNTITGVPDSSDIWTGGTSSATFTPTTVPVATLTDQQWYGELARVRTQLLHGFVPPSMPAGVLGINPAHKLYWGSDTNLYRISAGLLGTDQVFNAIGGLKSDAVATSPSTSPICPNGTGGAFTTSGCAGGTAGLIANTIAPPWAQYMGDGSDGANLTASGALAGVKYYTNFTVPFGNTVTISNAGVTIHATGTVTIAGKITTQTGSALAGAGCGGSGGGSGGGAAAGTAGTTTQILPFGANTAQTFYATTGGTAGAISGGNGTNGAVVTAANQRLCLLTMGQTDGIGFGGGAGTQGGSAGGAKGQSAGALTIIAQTITGTDGSHTGIIDLSGGAAAPAAANSTGAGSGSGAGSLILSSQNAIATPPTVYQAGGAGGLCVVPDAVFVGGSCTSPPKLTLGVSAGAFSGTAAVVQAGAGCGTGTGGTWLIQGGGGTQTTAVINPTWSGGTVASATVTAGDSAGYTSSTYTTCGTGGDGGSGWNKTLTGW